MKKRVVYIGLVFFLTVLVSSYAEESIKATFINNTGYTVKELYISPTSHDNWYDNLLKGSTVPNGDSIEITIPKYNSDSFIYDLMAVDSEGDNYSKYEVDFTNPDSRKVELTFDDYEGNASDNRDGSAAGGDYNSGYKDGYRDAYRDAYSEAYKEGYKAGLSAAVKNLNSK